MGRYLDSRGLVTLWNKIKSYFVDIYDRIEAAEADLEGVVYSEDGDASAGYSSTSSIENRLLPECIIPREDGLYQNRGDIIYPVSHPPLSTQPSILPLSFGTYDIYEVLVPCKSSNKISRIQNLNTYSPYVVFENEINLNNIKFEFDVSGNYTIKLYNNLLGIFPNNMSTPCYTLSLSNNNSTLNISDTTGGHGPLIVDIFWVDYIDDIIPSNATIIEASSFNSNNCVPAICEKINNNWTVRNTENVIPDFTLVRYFIDRNDYYYYLELNKKVSIEFGVCVNNKCVSFIRELDNYYAALLDESDTATGNILYIYGVDLSLATNTEGSIWFTIDEVRNAILIENNALGGLSFTVNGILYEISNTL